MSYEKKFDPLISVQKSQHFRSFDSKNPLEVNFDQISLLPNQIAYKIDCRTADFVSIKGNTKSLFNLPQLDTLDQLFEMVRPNNVDRFVDETHHNFNFLWADPKHAQPMRNSFSSVYELKKVGSGYYPFLRQTFTLRSDKKGIITHTGCIWTEMPSLNKVQLNALGKNLVSGPDAIFHKYQQLKKFEGILSVRELEILQLIADGDNTKKISERLFISTMTVNTHRKNMLKKMEANNSAHLVALAKDMGLV